VGRNGKKKGWVEKECSSQSQKGIHKQPIIFVYRWDPGNLANPNGSTVRSNAHFDAQPFAHAHERIPEFVQALSRSVSPEGVARFDVHELGGVSAEEKGAQIAVLAELEIQHLVHLEPQPNNKSIRQNQKPKNQK
jgi:hypothetical protein